MSFKLSKNYIGIDASSDENYHNYGFQHANSYSSSTQVVINHHKDLPSHHNIFLPLTICDPQIISMTQPINSWKLLCRECRELSRNDPSYQEVMAELRGSRREAEASDYHNRRVCCCITDETLKRSIKKRKALIRIGYEDNYLTPNSGFFPILVHMRSDVCDPSDGNSNGIYIGARFESIRIVQRGACPKGQIEWDLIDVKKRLPSTQAGQEIAIELLPQIFQDLFEEPELEKSDWSFGLTLAYYFGDSICPRGSYFRLKLGLLLSILSMNEHSKNRETSILAIGQDSLILNRLMIYASKLANSKHIHSSPLLPITGTSRILGEIWIDGGSLMLAGDGVCVIAGGSNISSLPEKEKTFLKQALETDEVLVKMPNGIAEQTFVGNLKSTVWTHLNDRRKIPEKIPWKEIFGMVYPVQITQDDSWVYFQDKDPYKLPLDLWRSLMNMHRDYPRDNMTLTVDADRLIRGYYMAIRRVRGQQCHRLSLPTLISLAKSFAMLSMRLDQVTKSDALMAIMLYEESLTSLTGDSPLDIEPIAHIRRNLSHIIKKCNHDLTQFEDKLIQFLKEYLETNKVSDPTSDLPREE